MTYTSAHVSHSSREGWILHVEERSLFRDTVDDVAAKVCEFTGHRFCNSFYSKVWAWADKKAEERFAMTIDEQEAQEITPDASWWLDDEE